MANNTYHSVRTRMPVPQVAIPLLALLLVFISSVTHQQVAETQLSHGYLGPLNHLVVSTQNDAARTQSGENENDASPGDDREMPYWRSGDSTPFPVGRGAVANGALSDAGQLPPPPDFLTPLLRAPPLA